MSTRLRGAIGVANPSIDAPLFAYAYAYDGLHRRVTRTEDGAATRFYYNLRWQVLAEADDANRPTAIYSYHPKYLDAVAVRITPTDEHFFTHDALFNVTAAIERTTKNVVERYAYSPYGTPTVLDDDFSDDADNRSDFGNEYLFTGRRTDPGSGLQLNRHRYYHAPLGRWVNRDQIGYRAGTVNLYGYVSQRPSYYIDPSGLVEINCNCDGIFAVVDCQGLARDCCDDACGEVTEEVLDDWSGFGQPPRHFFTGEWWIRGTPPPGPGVPEGYQETIAAPHPVLLWISRGPAYRSCKTPLSARGRRGGQGKGERRLTSKPDKPHKKQRQDPNNPDKILEKDPRTGKEISKPKPPGWEDPNAKPPPRQRPPRWPWGGNDIY